MLSEIAKHHEFVSHLELLEVFSSRKSFLCNSLTWQWQRVRLGRKEIYLTPLL